MKKALEGIKVVDLTSALSGPFCTMMLADFGADVLKIEPLHGDQCRTWAALPPGDRSRHRRADNLDGGIRPRRRIRAGGFPCRQFRNLHDRSCGAASGPGNMYRQAA